MDLRTAKKRGRGKGEMPPSPIALSKARQVLGEQGEDFGYLP